MHSFIKEFDNLHHFLRAAVHFQNFPECFPVHSVKSLGEVNKDCVEKLALFNGFFLELANSEDHFCC